MSAPKPISLPRQLAIIGFVGFPLIVLVLGAVALPAIIATQLITRGATEAHPSWLLLGLLAAIPWLLMLRKTLTKKRA